MKKYVLLDEQIFHCDDPLVYAGVNLCKWERSPAGQWAIAHCNTTPEFKVYHSTADDLFEDHRVMVVGEMTEENYLYYSLKWL